MLTDAILAQYPSHNRKGLVFVRTCGACPEQYDVYKTKKLVGYLRLRHGSFTVSYPHVGGELIYHANPKGDGLFEEEERDVYLDEAAEAILKHL